MRYVLITAARNEGRFVEQTIRSVIAQSVLPARWAIVSDGSTDGTDEIVASFARAHPFIGLHRIEDRQGRNFASQAHALNRAAADLAPESFDFIGCLDADIVVEPDYFRRVLEAFRADPMLGVAGGYIHEEVDGRYRPRPHNSVRSVAGAVQMFRRSCFDRIGPFTPVPHGGLDTVAEVKARMAGFRVRSLPELRVRHLRRTGADVGPLSAAFRGGLMAYEVGYHPLYELSVCARRVRNRIPIASSLGHFIGFASGYLVRRERAVPSRLVAYLRKEQMSRLAESVRALVSAPSEASGGHWTRGVMHETWRLFRDVVPPWVRKYRQDLKRARQTRRVQGEVARWMESLDRTARALYERELGDIQAHGLSIFPYPWSRRPLDGAVQVRRGRDGAPYVLRDDRPLFFPAFWRDERIRQYYGWLLTEQHPQSPHRYSRLDVSSAASGTVLVDVGCAEGIWAFDNASRAAEIILCEPKVLWHEALRRTFAGLGRPFQIVGKPVGETDGRTGITIDSLLARHDGATMAIKVDVEGDEQSALAGARETLRRAARTTWEICLYHNPDDEERVLARFRSSCPHLRSADINPGYMMFVEERVPRAPFLRKGVVRIVHEKRA